VSVRRFVAGGYTATHHPHGTWIVVSPSGEKATKPTVFEAIAWIVSNVNGTS
jgi:hypothetical protein